MTGATVPIVPKKCDLTSVFFQLGTLKAHLTLHTNIHRNMHQYIIALISPLKVFCIIVAKSRYCSHRFNNLEAKTCGKTCGEHETFSSTSEKSLKGMFTQK